MEMLDNAMIVKKLSDPTSIGNVWSMAKGLIESVEFTEYEWGLEEKHKSNRYLAVADEDSFDNWCRLWDSYVKQWKNDLECLNLEDLDRWLVDDSKDITEMNFRLNKIKYKAGKLWNLEEASELHTDILHLTDRLAYIIMNLRRNAYICMYDLEDAESFARQRAWGIIRQVCQWLRNIIEIQKRMQKIIKGAENILNPQPDTSTEQEQRVEQNIILQREDIKLIFDKAVRSGLMKFEDGYYCWLKESKLLAYFCKQVSLRCDLAKKYSEKTGEPQTNWKAFSGVFKIIARQGKNKGCWSLKTGRQIEDFMKGYMKYYSTFAPNGCELVDDLF